MRSTIKRPSQVRGQKHLNRSRVHDTLGAAFGIACLASIAAVGTSINDSYGSRKGSNKNTYDSIMYLAGGAASGVASLGFFFAGASRRGRAEKHFERRVLVGPLDENIEELHDIFDRHLASKNISKKQHAQHLKIAIKEVDRIFRENDNNVETQDAIKDIKALTDKYETLSNFISEKKTSQQQSNQPQI